MMVDIGVFRLLEQHLAFQDLPARRKDFRATTVSVDTRPTKTLHSMPSGMCELVSPSGGWN